MAIDLPRSFRTEDSFMALTSWPSTKIWPDTSARVPLCNPKIARLVTDLPEPDSPTIPSVLPFSTENERLSTA